MQNQPISLQIQQARQALGERRFDDARQLYRAILQQDPAQPRAWLALSAIAQAQGELRESITAVRSAVAAWKRSGNQQFITELSMRLLVLGEYQQARDLIASADWSDPLILRHSMGLVQYLGLAEAHQHALQLADFALSQIDSPPAALWYARANALRHLGRLSEATEAYEHCLALDPLHAEAHWTLAHHQPSAVPASRIPRLRKAMAHVQPGSDNQIYVHYAMFKELDQAGDTQEAWNLLQAGARLKRAQFRYDGAMADASYRELQKLALPVAAAGTIQISPVHRHTPIFIVGLPRSGTTLLERMLGKHPRVASAGELNDFPLQMAWEINRFIGEFPSPETIHALANVDFSALGQAYLARTAWRTQDKPYLIDKLPGNVAYAGLIHRALPAAKILCLRRGQMDSGFSVYRHLFSANAYPYSYDLGETAAHYRRFTMLAEHWQQHMPEAFRLVEYEDLIEKPEQVMAQIAQFCGLEFMPGLVDIRSNTSPSATASASQVRDGINPQHAGQWRRYATQLARLQGQ